MLPRRGDAAEGRDVRQRSREKPRSQDQCAVREKGKSGINTVTEVLSSLNQQRGPAAPAAERQIRTARRLNSRGGRTETFINSSESETTDYACRHSGKLR